MATLIHDQHTEEQLHAQRVASGADRWDEVWEGVYVMNPLPNNEHQRFVSRLTYVLCDIVENSGMGSVFPGVNVSDSKDDWTQNYRGPDVAVYLNDTQAEDCGTFWFGGPDLAIEIVSPHDTVREKLGFYEKVNTRELLIIDRDPWQLELHRLVDNKLVLVGTSSLADPKWLSSESVQLRLRLVPGEQRPQIEVQHLTDNKTWCL